MLRGRGGLGTTPIAGGVRQEAWIDDIRRNRRWLKMVVALSFLCLAGVVAALVVSVLGYRSATNTQSSTTHLISRVIPVTPFAHYLDATDAPLAMLLENDLSSRVGHVYRVWSRSAQPHTLTIQSGGHNPTWDGTSKTATFGGAVGDGFVFEVVDKNKVVLIAVNNVVFS